MTGKAWIYWEKKTEAALAIVADNMNRRQTFLTKYHARRLQEYILYYGLLSVVLLLCVVLQSPARGVTVMCYTAVSSLCYVLCCSLRPVVLLCVVLQSPSCGVPVMYCTAVSILWCCCYVLYCSLHPVVKLLCVVLQSPAYGDAVMCCTVVSSPLCCCYVLYCSLQPVVLLLCVVLQSPAYGDAVMCCTAVSSPLCCCYVLYCSLHPVVVLLCVVLQSPSRGVAVMCCTAVSSPWCCAVLESPARGVAAVYPMWISHGFIWFLDCIWLVTIWISMPSFSKLPRRKPPHNWFWKGLTPQPSCQSSPCRGKTLRVHNDENVRSGVFFASWNNSDSNVL